MNLMKQQFTYDVMGITDNIASGNSKNRKTLIAPISISLLDTHYAFGKRVSSAYLTQLSCRNSTFTRYVNIVHTTFGYH